MDEILKAIGPELKYFDEYFTTYFKSHVPLLDRIMGYIAKRKGKQIRPLFVLLCARLGGDVNDSSYRAALFVEMIHTSSLVHDDIVDESSERRGSFSTNALWNNKAAVLVGDNLFTRSVLLLLENKDHEVLKIVSDAIERVINGELLQLYKTRKLNLKEDVYFEIIKGKTASLLSSACAAGAASTFSDKNLIDIIYKFGENAGIAFQIKDDLLEYSNEEIGKPKGNDIKERKITLPLLHTLNNCEPALKKRLIRIVKSKGSDTNSINFLMEQVRNNGGVQYAEEKMFFFKDEALRLLYHFPASETRLALEALVRFIVDRKH